jgi:hypothetical protein
MTLIHSHSIERQMLDALLAAAGLAPDDFDYEVALDATEHYAASFDALPSNFSTRLVEEVEWALQLGLDEQHFAAAVAAVQRVLEPPRPPDLEPDAFLEMAYEDRVSGDQSD